MAPGNWTRIERFGIVLGILASLAGLVIYIRTWMKLNAEAAKPTAAKPEAVGDTMTSGPGGTLIPKADPNAQATLPGELSKSAADAYNALVGGQNPGGELLDPYPDTQEQVV